METMSLEELMKHRKHRSTASGSVDEAWRALAAGADAVVVDGTRSVVGHGCQALRAFGHHYKTTKHEDGRTIIYKAKGA